VANEVSKFSGLSKFRETTGKPDGKPTAKVEAKMESTPGRDSKSPSELRGAGELNLPTRKKPIGQRRDVDYRQKAVLLKESSIDEAEVRLRRNHKGTTFSELMQALLEQWLAG